ncbi:hypothetical protein J6590_041168 [Homalodisca vitripennis]|nr:hypothetical protein J6590_041168 [Homalodisca vitripennis]
MCLCIRVCVHTRLETAKVTKLDVIHLRFYSEYQWLLDFAIYTLGVYIITEIYTYYLPLKDEVNLSMLWCLLVLFFTFKNLLMLTVQYFQGSESVGERSTVIVTAFAYLLVAMVSDVAILLNINDFVNAFVSLNDSKTYSYSCQAALQRLFDPKINL